MKGVHITQRDIIKTEDKGRLIELYKHGRNTEVYLSTIYPQKFKGWHRHKKLTQKFICVKGEVLVILIDSNNVREEHVLIATKPEVLDIKPGITIGIRCISHEEAYLVCMPDPEYDPSDKGEKETIVVKDGD